MFELQIPLKVRRVRRYQRGNQNPYISKKNRQHNGQKKKYKKTNNDLQNIHIKLKIELHEPQLNHMLSPRREDYPNKILAP
jgi:hypothetical protein